MVPVQFLVLGAAPSLSQFVLVGFWALPGSSFSAFGAKKNPSFAQNPHFSVPGIFGIHLSPPSPNIPVLPFPFSRPFFGGKSRIFLSPSGTLWGREEPLFSPRSSLSLGYLFFPPLFISSRILPHSGAPPDIPRDSGGFGNSLLAFTELVRDIFG